eukprot:jgi/Chrzof1/2078/Cz11g01310.t1
MSMPSSTFLSFNYLQVHCENSREQYYTTALGNQLHGHLPAYTSSIWMLSAEELVVDLGPADNSVTQPNSTIIQLEQHACCDGPSSLAHVREHAPAHHRESPDHAIVGNDGDDDGADDGDGADAMALCPHDGDAQGGHHGPLVSSGHVKNATSTSHLYPKVRSAYDVMIHGDMVPLCTQHR